MALKDTVKQMRDLLNGISHDLEKSDGGNKAASQRVRTGTVKLEKLAKVYRKESIKTEKTSKGQKKSSKKPVAAAAQAKGKAKPEVKKPVAAAAQAKGKAKPVAAKPKATEKPGALSLKKPSAKLPVKRTGSR